MTVNDKIITNEFLINKLSEYKFPKTADYKLPTTPEFKFPKSPEIKYSIPLSPKNRPVHRRSIPVSLSSSESIFDYVNPTDSLISDVESFKKLRPRSTGSGISEFEYLKSLKIDEEDSEEEVSLLEFLKESRCKDLKEVEIDMDTRFLIAPLVWIYDTKK